MPISTTDYLDLFCTNKDWGYEVEARRTGLDRTKVRGYIQRSVDNCTLAIPEGTVLTEVEASEEVAAHTYLNINGVDIHCYDVTPIAGQTIRGKITVELKTWEPKGAAERRKGRKAWRNHAFMVAVRPAIGEEEAVSHSLRITNTSADGYYRKDDHIVSESRYAHLSNDGRRNQDLRFVKVGEEVVEDVKEVADTNADQEPVEVERTYTDDAPKVRLSLGDLIRAKSGSSIPA